MTLTAPAPPEPAAPPGLIRPLARVDIVVPVYNEQGVLPDSIRRLHAYCSANVEHDWRIVIADNASTDDTLDVAGALADALERISVLHLERKGRGRALPPLISALARGHSEVAIGTRLAPGSRVVRGRKRELISRSYNRLLRVTLRARFSDAQCGFKAIRADAARRLLPLVADEGWFFDTELLVWAQRQGMRIHEVAVDWIDDPDSRVDIVSTAAGDLRGVLRMRFDSALPRFLAIGAACTLAYALLYLVLRGWLGASVANAVALALTAVANTQANRRLSFRIRGRAGLVRQHAAGALVYLIALGLTDGALALLSGLDPHPARLLEVAVLVLASAVATVTRYVALRSWVFAGGRRLSRALGVAPR